jgi:ABC-type lipoprotein release transport system permease subunit
VRENQRVFDTLAKPAVAPSRLTLRALVVATILSVAALSASLPAWRASRLDPHVVVLRTD